MCHGCGPGPTGCRASSLLPKGSEVRVWWGVIRLSAVTPSDERQMPRLAANLGYLFADRPLLERFAAAAASGFKAVELQFPYGQPAAAVRREIERHRLRILGINTPLGAAGEAGLAGVPGRERDFDALLREA